MVLGSLKTIEIKQAGTYNIKDLDALASKTKGFSSKFGKMIGDKMDEKEKRFKKA
ncbi:MAG: hypothetical protein MUC49_19685 [Raineya sp.]|jgi:hypothetical protein|nr:hypothetical protein [Raineya sp.]